MARSIVRFSGQEVAGEVVPATPKGLIPAEGIIRIGQELELVSSPAGLRALAAACKQVAEDLDAQRQERGKP
jgi:hypothetical protein